MSMTFDIQPASHPTPEKDRVAKLVDPGFGRVFTDHMAIVRYNQAKGGWYETKIEARANFQLDPAGAVLHYAQEIFEGLKAYKRDDGGVNLFRPDANARRFKDSADRMAMAQLPEDVFIEAVEQVVRIDRAWMPGGEGSLYLRPFMIASETFLGVKPSSEYIFAVIASPVGSYFKGGPAPVSIWVSENYTRAAVGGTGAVKCGGNYAASLRAQAEAIQHGCDQVVFLDALERRYIEELGGMNVFFVFDDGSLATPPLGTILPGITRDSIIKLARDAGKTVREEPYSLDQWRKDAASGKLKEAFACGTAAVISPIGKVRSVSGDFDISGGAAGPVGHEAPVSPPPEGTELLRLVPPKWNEEGGMYQLSYEGRACCMSNKNVQLANVADDGVATLQVGKLRKDMFNMDLRGVLSPFQAFAIALAIFDQSSVRRRF